MTHGECLARVCLAVYPPLGRRRVMSWSAQLLYLANNCSPLKTARCFIAKVELFFVAPRRKWLMIRDEQRSDEHNLFLMLSWPEESLRRVEDFCFAFVF